MNDSCPCKGCKDRCADPNCHAACRRYIGWKQDETKRKTEERHRKTMEDNVTSYSVAKQEKIKKIRKSIKWSSKR